MRLSLEQIKAITCGAVKIDKEPQGIVFHRFTQEQYDLYEKKNTAFFKKAKGTAGVKLSFRTDSRTLFIRMLTEYTCLRQYFSMDICVNGELIGAIDNYSNHILPEQYVSVELPMGEFSETFSLGEGEKNVEIHLPWNAKVYLNELVLDDGAFIQPAKPKKRLLAFGDSITHGYDALHPSRRYIARLAEALGAEEFNKAIGGERFYPELAATKDDINPDYIVVAYGTNDWRHSSRDQFCRDSEAFIQNIIKNYPGVKTFVITPIWRKIYEMETDFSSFFEIESILCRAAQGWDQITVVKGFDLVPHDSRYFGDGTLHPTDEGFEYYFNNLWAQIKDTI